MLTRGAALGSLTFAGREENVSQARAFVASLLGSGRASTEVAVLLASELVTNAVQHTASGRQDGTVTLVVIDTGGRVRVSVIDDGSTRSIPVVKGETYAPDGRGLLLVHVLADEWGYDRHPTGTTVWFRLAA